MKTLLYLLLLLPLPAWGQTGLIVRLNDDASADLRAALAGEASMKQTAFPAFFEGVLGVAPVHGPASEAPPRDHPLQAYLLEVADSTALLALEARWAAHPEVAYVQRNHRYRLDTSTQSADDPLLDSLSHVPVIRAQDAWGVTRGSPSVRVGVVDTGLYFDHPDLAGQVWINPAEDLNGNGQYEASDLNGVDDDGNGYIDDVRGFDFVDRAASVEQGDFLVRDPDPSDDGRAGGGRGHGTLVAGVLAAAHHNGEGISGIAPGVRLVPLRAFGSDGLGDDDDIAAAILYAADMGLDVVNLSFGDVFISPLMQEAIAYAVTRGTVVVASAGNLGGDEPHYPSDYPEVISVAWLSSDGAGLSSRGTHGIGIELGAPGSSIFTTLMPNLVSEAPPSTQALYGRRSGSSMAAPMVSAAAALLRSVDPSLSPATIRSILTGSAVDLGAPGWDHFTGAGRLDVATALSRALPANVGLSAPDHDSGVAGEEVALVGSAVHPAFASYSLYYAPGDEDVEGTWNLIAGPFTSQHLDDTLGVWNTAGLPEGVVTLRLAASLRTGGVVEDRRRIIIDRTPPEVDFKILDAGLIGAYHGVVADVETDDLSDVSMRVEQGGTVWTVTSDRRARRHRLTWADQFARGGVTRVEVIATNVAGLDEVQTTSLMVPPNTLNTALFQEMTLSVPHGYLLPRTTDFDQDGLLEITLNQYQEGWIGDTLGIYEWAGADFRVAAQQLANVIPRDVGDTDGDGLVELLTQVTAVTLVLEQPSPGRYPTEAVFIDTTGLRNPFDPDAAFGARLTDLDEDGAGEILVHNTRQWRLLERAGDTYLEVLRLENPTSTANSEITQNEFQQPVVLIEDFDGDSRLDVLTGDGDGDWILYEVDGDNALRVAWTYETTRYNAGARMASGDFDGDGQPEFVTFTQNWPQPTRTNEREPDIGLYYYFDNVGDDQYTLVDSLPVPGALSRHGAMASGDFDGDGRDELVLVQAPDLYVLRYEATVGWHMLFHRGAQGGSEASGLRSIAHVVDDFDGDGRPELIIGGADERLHLFSVRSAGTAMPAPLWTEAYAVNAEHVRLAWQSQGADSVAVFRATPAGPFDLVGTTTAQTFEDETRAVQHYRLQGWFGGQASPLSEVREVVPHAPAFVTEILYPTSRTVELVFSEPLDVETRVDQFALDSGVSPASLLLGRGGRAALLRFEDAPEPGDQLQWKGVRDQQGTPVGQTQVVLNLPAAVEQTLIISEWTVLTPRSVRLAFSEALDPVFATDLKAYTVHPEGQVIAVQWDPDRAAEVVLEIEGRPVGATGQETSLVVTAMQSVSGNRLAPEGRAVILTQAAMDLRAVYVYPNPYREGIHAPRVVVAGLPLLANVQILSLQGKPIRVLEERDGNGGVSWDLTDESGARVPSGIYLVRVEAPDLKPVLKKAALIR